MYFLIIAILALKTHAQTEPEQTLQGLLKTIFAKNNPPNRTTCDSYYADRAKVTEEILRSTHRGKGSFLLNDTSSNYYKQVMYGPLLTKLAPIPPAIKFIDSPYSRSDALSARKPKEHCKIEADLTPEMDKLIEILMDDDKLIPSAVKQAYKKAKKAGDLTYGRDALRIVARALNILPHTDIVKPTGYDAYHMIQKNLELLYEIAKNKMPEMERKLTGNREILKLTVYFP